MEGLSDLRMNMSSLFHSPTSASSSSPSAGAIFHSPNSQSASSSLPAINHGHAMNAGKPMIKGERRYPCGFPGCKWVFTRSNHVIRHHQRVHPGFNNSSAASSTSCSSASSSSNVQTSSNSCNSGPKNVTSSNSIKNSSNNVRGAGLNSSCLPGVKQFTGNHNSTSSSLINNVQCSTSSLLSPSSSSLLLEAMRKASSSSSKVNNDHSSSSSSNSNLCNLKCDFMNCGQSFRSGQLLSKHQKLAHGNQVMNPGNYSHQVITGDKNHHHIPASLEGLNLSSKNNFSNSLLGHLMDNSGSNSHSSSLALLNQLSAASTLLQAAANQQLIHSEQTDVTSEFEEDESIKNGNCGMSILDLVLPKPHLCPYSKCGKSFTRRDHLKRHIINFHVDLPANHPSPPESPSSGELNLTSSTINHLHSNSNNTTILPPSVSNLQSSSSPSSHHPLSSSSPSPHHHLLSSSSPSNSIPYVDIEPEVVLEVEENKIWSPKITKNRSMYQSSETSSCPSNPKRSKLESSSSVVIEEDGDDNQAQEEEDEEEEGVSSSTPTLFSSSLIDVQNKNSNSSSNFGLNVSNFGSISLRGKRPFMCDMDPCNKSYTKHSHLIRHKVETHKMKKPIPKIHSHPSLSSSSSSSVTTIVPVTITSNLNSSSTNSIPPPPINLTDRPYVCDFPGCRWSFKRQYHLDRHYLTHRTVLKNESSSSSNVQSINNGQNQNNNNSSDGHESSDGDADQGSHLLNLSLTPTGRNRNQNHFDTSLLSPSPSPHLSGSPVGTKFDWSTNRSSPPGRSPKISQMSTIQLFKCTFESSSKMACNQSFNSQHALQMHQYFVHSISPSVSNGRSTNSPSLNVSSPGKTMPSFFKSPVSSNSNPGSKTASKALSDFSILAASNNNGMMTNGQESPPPSDQSTKNMSDELMYILSLRNIIKAFEESQQNNVQGSSDSESENNESIKSGLASQNQLSMQQLQQMILMNALLNGSAGKSTSPVINQSAAELLKGLNGNVTNGTNTTTTTTNNVTSATATSASSNMNSPNSSNLNCGSNSASGANGSPGGGPQKVVFSCDIPGCDKKFGRNCELTRHKLNHMDIWPFLCDYPSCGRKFKRKDVYKNHQRTHFKDNTLSSSSCLSSSLSSSAVNNLDNDQSSSLSSFTNGHNHNLDQQQTGESKHSTSASSSLFNLQVASFKNSRLGSSLSPSSHSDSLLVHDLTMKKKKTQDEEDDNDEDHNQDDEDENESDSPLELSCRR